MMATLIQPPRIAVKWLMLMLLLMSMAWAAAELLRPSRYWADQIGNPKYAQLMPAQFGDWIKVENMSSAVVNPVQAEMLDRIYSETVAVGYMNRANGRLMMVSLAYGRDQSTDTQLHTPDMCYPSQGFRVEGHSKHKIDTPWGLLPAIQLQTVMGQRKEPLTYLVRTGDQVTDGSLQRNLARLALAARGYKMDGLLIRVSEVSRDDDALQVQEQFLKDWFAAMSDDVRAQFIGRRNDRS
ncbi:MAG: exosortase C-terminal domain/associated protein EpsI [Aquabacterium sp.]